MFLYANEPVETRILRLLNDYGVATVPHISKILSTNEKATNSKIKNMSERGLLEKLVTQKCNNQAYKYSLSDKGKKVIQSIKDDYKTIFLAQDIFSNQIEKNLYKQPKRILTDLGLMDAGYNFLMDMNLELAILDKQNRTIHVLVEDIHQILDKINTAKFCTNYNNRSVLRTQNGEEFTIDVVIYYLSQIKYEHLNESDCGIKLVNINPESTPTEKKTIDNSKRKHNFDAHNARNKSNTVEEVATSD